MHLHVTSYSLLPLSQYSVFRGDSKELLRKNINEGTTAFCGLSNVLLDGKKCLFQMSPFWQTYVGVTEGRGGERPSRFGRISNPEASAQIPLLCRMRIGVSG